MKFKAVLLDIDGTLIDSNDAHASAWVDAFLECGVRVDFWTVRRKIGMGSDRLIPYVSGIQAESALGKRIQNCHGKVFREKYLPNLDVFPGTRELLEFFGQHGIKRVIATSASEEDLEALLEQGGLVDLIDDASNASDVENSKPDPDVIEAALEKTGEDPMDVIMIGDTPYDIQAAKRAGVPVVAVTCGGWDRDQLREATLVFEGPQDILEGLEAMAWHRSRGASSEIELGAN